MEALTSTRSLSSPPPPPPRHGLNGSNPLQRVYHSLSLSDDTCGHTGQSTGRLSTYNPLHLTSPRFTSSPGCWPRSSELLARFAYSGSCAEGLPAIRRF